MSAAASPPAWPARSRWDRWLLGGLALVSFLLVLHNYGWPVLPRQRVELPTERIQPLPGAPAHVFVIAGVPSEPNRPWVNRSGVMLLEDGVPYRTVLSKPDELIVVGGVRMMHEPGRVLFSTEYNSDPRTNGHRYALLVPVLYTRLIGQAALLVFALSTAALYWSSRHPRAAVAPARPVNRWRWYASAAGLLFAFGLYANTGTLSPYAITTFPHQSAENGYLYNPDHAHFRALHDFVRGAERKTWDQAIMLRRILYPVLAWPFMAAAGFEIGGSVASLVLNLAGFIAVGWLLRRRVGDQGALAALWLLALYPGAVYWGGLPYPYALITPLSLLLVLGLDALRTATGGKLVGLSVALGLGYLAYDFISLFLPAAGLLLLWQRRPGALVVSLGLQILPLGLWIGALVAVFDQNLLNSNSATYSHILNAYRTAGAEQFLTYLPALVESGAVTFFGANFIFLPGLFLLLLAVNPLTARVGLSRAEACLLAVAAGIFVFNHFAPEYGGWQMRGTWIARIYQPVFPVFICFAARWWQARPPLHRWARVTLGTVAAGFALGQGLIVFGPLLGNPARVSEHAYYRFYNHNDNHWVYEHCLKSNGRHPLGFSAPLP